MTTFSKYLHLLKAFLGIIETFDGIKISLISKDVNAKSSIICKFESVGISIFERFLQESNANSLIFITFDGKKIQKYFLNEFL